MLIPTQLVSSYFLSLNQRTSSLNHTELIFFQGMQFPDCATSLLSCLHTITKWFVALYGRLEGHKKFWDLGLSWQNFAVHLLVFKTSFVFSKKTLISHCQTAWLQTNAVPLQLLIHRDCCIQISSPAANWIQVSCPGAGPI